MNRLALLGFCVAMMPWACSSGNVSALGKRGISPEERVYQVQNQHTWDMKAANTPGLIEIYKQGHVSEGMTDLMVNDLWGKPDSKSDSGKTWTYLDDKGKSLTVVRFDSTRVLYNRQERSIVTSITGDRYGGK